MEKKKLLILNGGHSEIPLIQAGKRLGFHVITSGNAPLLIGHKYADEYIPADFSDKEEILRLAVSLDIEAICAGANDFGAITAAYVAEKMGLLGHDSYETTLIIHHKDLFKKFATENQIQTPYAESYSDKDIAFSAANRYSYPVMIKPIDLTGGKGITKVNSVNDYINAVEKAFGFSREKRIVVEEFFEGTQHSFSTFILNEKVVFYFSDNEYSLINPYLVSTSAAPAENIEKFAKALIDSAEKIAQSLHIVDGILHIQYLADSNTFTIIEVARRCSGDLYPYPLDCSSNIDWANWIIRAEAGIKCFDFPQVEQTGYWGRHCIMSSKNGVVDDVIISESIKSNIHSELMWWKKGDVIDNYMTQKLGIVILHYSTMEEMLEKTKIMNQLIRVFCHDVEMPVRTRQQAPELIAKSDTVLL